MNKRLHFFETEPIIAAVKTEEQLVRALSSECNVIFFLFGNICNIPKLVESVKERGKHAFVHLDLINGPGREGDRGGLHPQLYESGRSVEHKAPNPEACQGDRAYYGTAGLCAGLAGAGQHRKAARGVQPGPHRAGPGADAEDHPAGTLPAQDAAHRRGADP